MNANVVSSRTLGVRASQILRARWVHRGLGVRWHVCLMALLVCTTAVPGVLRASDAIRLEGFTEAYRDIELGSAETNVIVRVWAEEGELVSNGQTLVQLDATVLRAAVDVARKAASSRGEFEAAEQVLEMRQQRVEKTAALHARQHATDQELWNVTAERDEAAARLKAFKELNERRQLELLQAEAQLARLTIQSPIDGQIVERFKDVGQVVSPADPKLLRIVQLDPLKIIASGPATELSVIQAGMRLPVIIKEQRYEADVEFVSPVVDAQSRMRRIKLRVPNPQLRISSGLAVEVELSPIQRPLTRDQNLRQTLRQFPFLDHQ